MKSKPFMIVILCGLFCSPGFSMMSPKGDSTDPVRTLMQVAAATAATVLKLWFFDDGESRTVGRQYVMDERGNLLVGNVDGRVIDTIPVVDTRVGRLAKPRPLMMWEPYGFICIVYDEGNAIVVINPKTRQVIHTIPLLQFARTTQPAFMENLMLVGQDEQVFIFDREQDFRRIAAIDLGAQVRGAVGLENRIFVVAGNRLFVIQKFDNKWQVIDSEATGNYPEAPVVEDGRIVVRTYADGTTVFSPQNIHDKI